MALANERIYENALKYKEFKKEIIKKKKTASKFYPPNPKPC
jgi:hypothetical protein